MQVFNLSEQHSLICEYLKEIRHIDIQKDRLRFRRNIERIGEVMAIEVSKTLQYAQEQVTTCLGVAQVMVPQDQVVLATILRAGLPLHQGFLNMFDGAENAFVSAYRKVTQGKNGEPGMEIVSKYLTSPKLEGKTLMIIDPMLATGKSMEIAYNALLHYGTPAKVHLCCTISSPQAIDYLQTAIPGDVTLWCAAVDEGLNKDNYIVPGIGDAGDLCFGAKLEAPLF